MVLGPASVRHVRLKLFAHCARLVSAPRLLEDLEEIWPCIGHRDLRGFPPPELGRRLRSAAPVTAAVKRDEVFESLSTEAVFCEHVYGIAISVDFTQIYALRTHSLLNPQHVRVEMAELAKALACAYPNCSA